MKEYHFERTNSNLRNLGLILVLPLFLGGFVLLHGCSHPLLSKVGLVLTVFSLLGIIICYLKVYEKFVLRIDSDNLIVRRTKSKKERKTLIKDIAVIEYNKSIDALSTLMTRKPPSEIIKISSIAGKQVFVGNNTSGDFEKFFDDIRTLIHAKEVHIYSKQIRMVQLHRFLYLNPQHESSSVVKKRMKQAKFYYPLIIFVAIIVILLLVLNFFNIPELIGDYLMKYDNIK